MTERGTRRLPAVLMAARLGAFLLGYALLQEVGLRLALPPAGIAAFWPAAGLAIGVLAWQPLGRWPAFLAVLAGVNLAGNLAHGTGPALSAGLALANTVEPLVAAALVRRSGGREGRGVPARWMAAALLPAALVPCLIGAGLAVWALLAGDEPVAAGPALGRWFVAHALGVLAVLPAVVAFRGVRYSRWVQVAVPRVAEGAVVVLLQAILLWLVFGWTQGQHAWRWPYVVLPTMFWAVVRFGPRLTTVMSMGLTTAVIWGTANGGGPFAQAAGLDERLVGAQRFCVVIFVCCLALSEVIASREATERLLSERAEAMANAGEGIAFIAPDGRFAQANPAYATTLATTPGRLTGRRWESTVHIADRPAATAAHERMLAEGSASADVRGVRTDGSVFHMEITLVAQRDAEGRLQGYHCFMRDVSSRRAALEHVDQMFRLTPDLLCVAGVGGEALRLNPAWERVLGHPLQDLLGRSLLDLVHPDDVEATRLEWVRIASGEDSVGFENRYRCSDGSFRWLRWYSAVDQDREVIYAVAHDVTDSKRLTDQLSDSRDDALHASRMKSEFLATMSHEIRTPLNGVIGLTHLLGQTALDSAQRPHVEGIRTAGGALLAVINDILDFSKIEAGEFVLDEDDFRLETLVGDVATINEAAAAGKGLRLRTVFSSGLPAVLRGDPGRLRQVLINLVGNAVKFTTEGEVTVTASPVGDGEFADRPGLVLEVSDTGIGMDADALGRIFHAFGQADASTTRVYGGTGLGLAISRRLVEAMGGTLSVRSAPGEGSTFRVAVPVTNGTGPEPAPAESDPRRALDPAPGNRGRVLLVEDNDINQMVATGFLSALGFTVQTAADGVEALELAARHSFQVILMDCQMPNMDGYTATRHLRQRPGTARTPIIAMTANAFKEDRDRCIAAGMDDYLAKPIRAHDLEATILRWTGTSAPIAGIGPAAEGTSGIRERLDELVGDRTAAELALIERIVTRFLKRVPELVQLLDHAVRSQDATAAIYQAHTLQGAASNVGAQVLADICRTIENLGRDGSVAAMAAHHGRLQAALDQATTELADYLVDLQRVNA